MMFELISYKIGMCEVLFYVIVSELGIYQEQSKLK